MNAAKIHEEIESWLAASVHDQLSADERAAFQEHLAGCASCRALHEEEIAMSHMIADTFDFAKPDAGFEQRVVSVFRRTDSKRDGVGLSLIRLFHSRILRTALAAGVLLLTGVWLTGVTFSFLGSPSDEMMGAFLQDDHSFRALQARLSWEEQKADLGQQSAPASPHTPVEALRQLPSTIGSPAKAEDVTVTGPPVQTAETESALPVTVYSAKATQKQSSSTAAKAEIPNESSDSSTKFVEEAPNVSPPNAAAIPLDRKLIRKAEVELEVVKFDEAVPKITALVLDGNGYVATSSATRGENGKKSGEMVVKVLPAGLTDFLNAVRALGEVKNQTLGTDDVTKNYFDTDARLQNSRVLERRLVEMLQKSTGKVADLLQVEKELARVREQIEQMQGELKFMDAQVAFATVTITLSEKDMDAAAAFRLQRSAELALFSAQVEKTFAEVKASLEGGTAQISSSSLDRDAAGEVTAHLVLLLVPEEADTIIARIKVLGRVQNYHEKTERIAQGGSENSDTTKVKREKVELTLTISRTVQEPALQTTSLSLLTKDVNEKVARLKENAAQNGAEIRSSTFNGSANGYEESSITLRVPMQNYAALMKSFDALGKVRDVNIRREDRGGALNESSAPAEINIRVHNEPNLVDDESGLFATIRRTLGQGALALLWSLRMIGVAAAFLAPWVAAIFVAVWLRRRIRRRRGE